MDPVHSNNDAVIISEMRPNHLSFSIVSYSILADLLGRMTSNRHTFVPRSLSRYQALHAALAVSLGPALEGPGVDQ